jgi:hypothetical protein
VIAALRERDEGCVEDTPALVVHDRAPTPSTWLVVGTCRASSSVIASRRGTADSGALARSPSRIYGRNVHSVNEYRARCIASTRKTRPPTSRPIQHHEARDPGRSGAAASTRRCRPGR